MNYPLSNRLGLDKTLAIAILQRVIIEVYTPGRRQFIEWHELYNGWTYITNARRVVIILVVITESTPFAGNGVSISSGPGCTMDHACGCL